MGHKEIPAPREAFLFKAAKEKRKILITWSFGFEHQGIEDAPETSTWLSAPKTTRLSKFGVPIFRLKNIPAAPPRIHSACTDAGTSSPTRLLSDGWAGESEFYLIHKYRAPASWWESLVVRNTYITQTRTNTTFVLYTTLKCTVRDRILITHIEMPLLQICKVAVAGAAAGGLATGASVVARRIIIRNQKIKEEELYDAKTAACRAYNELKGTKSKS